MTILKVDLRVQVDRDMYSACVHMWTRTRVHTHTYTHSIDGFRVADMPDAPAPRADMTGLPMSWSQPLKLPYSC